MQAPNNSRRKEPHKDDSSMQLEIEHIEKQMEGVELPPGRLADLRV